MHLDISFLSSYRESAAIPEYHQRESTFLKVLRIPLQWLARKKRMSKALGMEVEADVKKKSVLLSSNVHGELVNLNFHTVHNVHNDDDDDDDDRYPHHHYHHHQYCGVWTMPW
jgi:hypothetical protein